MFSSTKLAQKSASRPASTEGMKLTKRNSIRAISNGPYLAAEEIHRGCELRYPANARRVAHRRVGFEPGEKRDGHGEQQEHQRHKFHRLHGLREGRQNLRVTLCRDERELYCDSRVTVVA